METIKIADLRGDILDRMDNHVLLQSLPEHLRQKLDSPTRLTRAMNRAMATFTREAKVNMLSGLIDVVELEKDPLVGTANGVDTYVWPEKAFTERMDSGLIKIILDGDEYPIDADNVVPVETLRFYNRSPFHKDGVNAFNVDFNNSRIYSVKDTPVKARIILAPEEINNDDEYGETAEGDDPVTEIPISVKFMTLISAMALDELVNSASSLQKEQGIPANQEQEAEAEDG